MMFLRKMLDLPEPDEPQGLSMGVARDFGIPIPQDAPSGDGALFADGARTLGLMPQPSLYTPDFQPYPGSLGGLSALRLLGSSGAPFGPNPWTTVGDVTNLEGDPQPPAPKENGVTGEAQVASANTADDQLAMTRFARQFLYDHFGGPEAAKKAITGMLMKLTNGGLSEEQAASVYEQMLKNLYDLDAKSLGKISERNGVVMITPDQMRIITEQIQQLDNEELRNVVGNAFAAAMRDGKVVCTDCRQ